MKLKTALMLVAMMSIALFLTLPRVAAADDGASLYKAKCAMCHGADGAGKPAAKIPSLLSDETKKAPDATLTDDIANGGAEKKTTHAFQTKGLAPDQIKMIVSYIRDMQKK
jgi:mono/diheme cytochrome c family protein